MMNDLLIFLIVAGGTMNLWASPIKAIIFDCDGVLVDSENTHYQAWRQAMQNQGSDLTVEEYYPYVGNSAEANAKLLAKTIVAGDWNRLIQDKKAVYHLLQQKGLPPIQTTIDFIHRLVKEKERLGLKLAVASAARKEEIFTNLKHLGIDRVFDQVLSGVDDLTGIVDPEGVNKPKPYIYLLTAESLRVRPDECIVIEDSAAGVQAGVSAGCFTIAVPNSHTQWQNLSHAHFEIDSFADLNVEAFLERIGQEID